MGLIKWSLNALGDLLIENWHITLPALIAIGAAFYFLGFFLGSVASCIAIWLAWRFI